MFLVGCDEHDERHHFAFQHPNDAEAVQFRHLQIEKRQVGSFAFDQSYRLDAGLRFTHDVDVRASSQQRRQVGSGGPLVIGDDHAHALCHVRVALASVATRCDVDLMFGVDNLFHTDKAKVRVRVGVVNVANKQTLYNFLSTFQLRRRVQQARRPA